MLTKDNVSKSVYCKVLSCLCGQCRDTQCLSVIVNSFSHDQISSLIDTYEGFPGIIRTLFLLYAFIMESENMSQIWWLETDMSVADRDVIIEKATKYMERHGNDVRLLEAYVLLVIPAYNASKENWSSYM